MFDPMISDVMNLLEELNVSDSSLGNIYHRLQRYIAPIAARYHIAQISMDVSVPDQSYKLKGFELHKTSNFHRSDSQDTALSFEYIITKGHKSIISVYPWEGYRFKQNEVTFISNFSKFIYLVYSRAALLENAKKAPMIDTMTGVLNNPGVRLEMQSLIQTHRVQDYAGVYFNLKSFKYVNNLLGSQNGDFILREYAGHIYRFLDPDNELVSRIGGDNFFVFLSKDHLNKFLNYLNELKISVPYGNKSVSVPMRARIGI